jgi:integrase
LTLALQNTQGTSLETLRLHTDLLLCKHTAELQALLIRIPQRERVMVLLDATTGLRRGELMALRWQDLDFENNIANITRSIYRNVVGKPKTKASRKPMPLHPIVVQELKQWKSESPYRADSDFLFPSIQKNGSQPLQPDMIFERHIRPVLGVTKTIGVALIPPRSLSIPPGAGH